MHDVIFTGIGGMGVLLAGEILTRSGTSQYKHVLWLPNYTTAQRGAPCDCTVILSNEEIYSPLIDQAEAVVVIAASQLKSFEKRAKPGGLILVETYGLQDKVEREDVKVVEIPALETASKKGNRLGANMVMLGAFVGLSKVVSPEHVEATIEKMLGGKFAGKDEVLQSNLGLFREGLNLGPGLLNS